MIVIIFCRIIKMAKALNSCNSINAFKLLVCAIADAQRRFADVQSGAVAAPASVTIGSVSESYAANTAAAIDATPKAQAAEYYRILCLYADVYRGCG